MPTRSFAFLFLACAGAAWCQTTAVTPQHTPIDAEGRLNWVVMGTVGPSSLAAAGVNAAWFTLFNEPVEYGPHWAGFGKRFGIRESGVATSGFMEAGLGALWGEDPRYPRAVGRPFKGRIANVVKMTFVARSRDGGLMPAYARWAAIPASNFLSNAWRPDSESTNGDAAGRAALGFVSRMIGNAFEEFWPDVRGRIFRHKNSPQR